MEQFRIKVENSAPSQTMPAKSVQWASPILQEQGVRSVVDLGCGRLRNLHILTKFFPKIKLVDTELQCNRIRELLIPSRGIKLLPINEFKSERKKYDSIFMVSVLHILPDPNERQELLKLAKKKVSPFGFLVVDVPTLESYYRQRCTEQNRFSDGWLMGTGIERTFYKNFHANELDDLVFSCTHFTLFKKVYVEKHIIRIYRNSE